MDFLMILEELPEALFVADVETGVIVYANKMAEKLVGLPKEKIIGLHQTQLHPPEYSSLYKEIFIEDTKNNYNNIKKRRIKELSELYVQKSDGIKIPIKITSKTFEWNGKKYIIGIFIRSDQVLSLKKKTFVLNELLVFTEAVFKQGSFQCYYRSRDPIFFLSDGAKRVLGINRNFVRLSSLLPYIKKDEQEIKNILQEIALGNLNHLQKEYEFYWQNGNEIKNMVIQFSFLKEKFLYGIIKDITKEKEHIQLIERKNQFFYMLSQSHKVLLFANEEEILLSQICKVIVETGKYLMSWVGYKKYNKERTIEVVSYYTKNEFLETFLKENFLSLPLSWGWGEKSKDANQHIASIVCRNNEILIEKIQQDSELRKGEVRSVIGIPIAMNDMVIGVLMVYSSFEDFDPEEKHILQEIAVNIGIGINIIRERKTKMRLLEQNILLTKILDNTSLGILIINKEGKILYVNKKFEEMSGYYMNELMGQNVNILKSGLHDHEFYQQLWDTIMSKKDWKGEIINKRKDGSLFLSRVFISPVLNEKLEISHFIQIIEDITLEKFYEEQIEKSQFYDSLTNLPNRTYFLEKLNQEIYKGDNLFVILIDVDQFSLVIQKVGFLISDKFLQLIADRIRSYIEKYLQLNVFLARIGNDEFGIILSKITFEDGIHFVENLSEFLKRVYRIHGSEFYLTASMGIALYPENAKTPDELLKYAEMALNRAKEEKGIGSYAFINPEVEKEFLDQVKIETLLFKNISLLKTKEKTKIQKTGFYLVYQPILDIKTNKIVSVEALIRWRDKELGIINPSKFIPIAEKNRLIIPLGEFIIEEIIKQILEWYEKDYTILPVSVNISYHQIHDGTFLKFFKRLIKDYHVDPALIEIEITENILLQNEEKTRRFIGELKDMNVKILIDDFGTGYSSLNYLLKYKFDAIKIDQFFIRKLDEEEDDSSLRLVRSIIQMSKSFGLKSIAEGIETQKQVEILLREDCDYGQGYYYSKPLNPMELEKFFKVHT